VTPLLELVDLNVRYGGISAVRNLSLRVEPGEIVGLIGPNGAGKSTTLHAIMGMVPSHSGEIRLAGASVLGRAPEVVARTGIALVPEGRRIFAELTVEENLRLGLSGRRAQEGGDEDIEAVYGLFPIVKEFRRRQAGALSGGQQQQLAIGRALVANPQLVLLDEPSLGLAPLAIDDVAAALTVLRQRGRSILIVEQRVELALRVCDRVYVLTGGEVALESRADAIGEDGRELIDAYLG
jgi:branched-chain amino acid transport system ATP-binding protein